MREKAEGMMDLTTGVVIFLIACVALFLDGLWKIAK